MEEAKPGKSSPRASVYRVQAEASPFTFCSTSVWSMLGLRSRDPDLGKEHGRLASSLMPGTKTSQTSTRTPTDIEGGDGGQAGCTTKAELPLVEGRGTGIYWAVPGVWTLSHRRSSPNPVTLWRCAIAHSVRRPVKPPHSSLPLQPAPEQEDLDPRPRSFNFQ